jgi:hypothetical protein
MALSWIHPWRSLTVANGSSGNTLVTVTPSGGYSGRVVWSLVFSSSSGTPLTACYDVDSLPVNNVSTTQLTIGTGTACSSSLPAARGNFRPLGRRAVANGESQTERRIPSATVVYAGLLLCGLLAAGRRRKRLPQLLAIVFLTAAGMGLTGCGGGGGGNNTGTSSTPPSSTTNYTITLTGTDSVNTAITASTTFTLTVN